jgi:hypothetical protein
VDCELWNLHLDPPSTLVQHKVLLVRFHYHFHIHIRPLRPLPFQCHLPDQPPVHSNSHHNHRISCSSLRQQTQLSTYNKHQHKHKHPNTILFTFLNLTVASQLLQISPTCCSHSPLTNLLNTLTYLTDFLRQAASYPIRNRTILQPPAHTLLTKQQSCCCGQISHQTWTLFKLKPQTCFFRLRYLAMRRTQLTPDFNIRSSLLPPALRLPHTVLSPTS